MDPAEAAKVADAPPQAQASAPRVLKTLSELRAKPITSIPMLNSLFNIKILSKGAGANELALRQLGKVLGEDHALVLLAMCNFDWSGVAPGSDTILTGAAGWRAKLTKAAPDRAKYFVAPDGKQLKASPDGGPSADVMRHLGITIVKGAGAVAGATSPGSGAKTASLGSGAGGASPGAGAGAVATLDAAGSRPASEPSMRRSSSITKGVTARILRALQPAFAVALAAVPHC